MSVLRCSEVPGSCFPHLLPTVILGPRSLKKSTVRLSSRDRHLVFKPGQCLALRSWPGTMRWVPAMLFEHWYLGLISTVCQRGALIRPCIFLLLLSDQRLLPAHYHCLRASRELAVTSEIYLHEFPPNRPAHAPLSPLQSWYSECWELSMGVDRCAGREGTGNRAGDPHFCRRKCSMSKRLQLALNGFSSLPSFSFKPKRNSL